jgi:RNA polymerase sigma-70 factor (ECF subfamily)
MLKKFFSKQKRKPNEAFRILYDMFYERVYKSAYFITRDPYLAQDAVQETFIKAFRNINDIEDGGKMGAWLSTIATRTSIDLMRKQKRWNGTPTEDVILETGILKEEGTSIEEEYEFVWLKERITEIITELKPEYREVLLLKFQHGLKDEEIAQLLGEKIGTIKSRIHRGRQRLKTVIKPELNVADGDSK